MNSEFMRLSSESELMQQYINKYASENLNELHDSGLKAFDEDSGDALEHESMYEAEESSNDAFKQYTRPEYPCLLCEKVFKRKFELKRHISRHTGQKSFKCIICSESFYHGGQLRKHKAEAHLDEKVFICSVCFEGFESRHKLSLHMKGAHSLDKPDTFQCEVCNVAFKTRKGLKEHDKTVHERDEKNTCLFCGQSFTYPSDLKRHERKHTGFRPYICNICEKAFPTANQLTKHLQQHQQESTGLKNFQCGECTRSFMASSDLKRHLRRAHKAPLPYKCQICKELFPTQEEFHTHRKEAHGIKVVPIEEKYVHECPYCFKKFRYPSDIKRHLSTHSSEKAFKCKVCDKRFKIERLAERHERTCTGDKTQSKTKKDRSADQEQVNCPICEKPFLKCGLKTHISTSHKELFPCKKCNGIFESRDQFEQHKKDYHLKLFSCEYCDKVFKNKQILENHVRIHTKETPFQCHICGRQFKQRVHLKGHIELHAGNRRKSCQFCSKSFNRQYDLKRHTKKHHGIDIDVDVHSVENENDIDHSMKEIINAVTGSGDAPLHGGDTMADIPMSYEQAFEAAAVGNLNKVQDPSETNNIINENDDTGRSHTKTCGDIATISDEDNYKIVTDEFEEEKAELQEVDTDNDD